MRCENCFALRTSGYEYPEEYCAAGVPDDKTVEFSDGWGCKFSFKAIEARVRKNDDARANQFRYISEWYNAIELKERSGIDVDEERGPFIVEAKHCVGLDHEKPYTRHGRKFYRPHRNYFNTAHDDATWSVLAEIGYAEEYKRDFFKLTEAGLWWLGARIGVHIYSEEA